MSFLITFSKLRVRRLLKHGSMNDASEHISKSQKKRQRKAAKKLLEKLSEDTGKEKEVITDTRDPLLILKDKLAEAKKANNHELARQIRQDIWVLQDTSAGHSPSLSAAEVSESLKRISENCAEIKTPEMKRVEAKNPEQKHLKTNNSQTNRDPEAGGALSPIEKKIRNLEKKLQQISRLKSKLESGEKLEQTQISKINSEEMVRKEIEEMKETLASISVTM